MAARGTEDSDDPISQSTASSEDLLPRGSSPEGSAADDATPAAGSAAAAAGGNNDDNDDDDGAGFDDLLDLLQDSDEDEPAASPDPTKQAEAPPPKRTRRLPGWMAAAPPVAVSKAAAASAARSSSSSKRAGPPAQPIGGGRAGSGIAGRQMERAFEEEQAVKRRKLEDAKASTARAAAAPGGDATQRLLGALVDPAATAATAASRPQRTLLTRALFPPRVVVFDVETTGFAQDDVIVEIGAIELIGGVRTVSPAGLARCPPSAQCAAHSAMLPGSSCLYAICRVAGSLTAAGVLSCLVLVSRRACSFTHTSCTARSPFRSRSSATASIPPSWRPNRHPPSYVTARTQSRRLSGWLNAIDCVVVIAILQVIPAFVKFVDGAVIVGHNVSFDLRMLNAELQRLGAAEKENAFSLRRFKLQTEHLPRQARGQAK